MLEFIVAADLEKDILLKYNPSCIKDLKLIGSEQDGNLIYKFYDETNGEKSVRVGIYECSTKENRILFTTKKNFDIKQATVNQDGSMLAFVSYDVDEKSAATLSGYPSYVYEIYLVHLLHDNEVTCMNLCSSTILQVQFRYKKMMKNSYENLINPTDVVPEQQIIIFKLKEEITLYNITAQTSEGCDRDTIPDSDEIKSRIKFTKEEVLVKTFIWSQWVPPDQCLFYIHFRSPPKTSDTENAAGNKPLLPMLSCLQFHDEIHYETVLTLPIELPCLEDGLSIQCEFIPLLHIVSERRINAEVLTQPSGIVCICLYHFARNDFVDVFDEENSSEDTLTLSYSIILLHHGCTLICEIPQVPLDFEFSSLTFMFHSDNYIMVLLPGVCIHLLDIGLLHEPNNHILIQDSYGTEIFEQLEKCSRNHVLLSSEKSKILMINLPLNLLLKQLDKSNFTSTRLAIIHYILIHTKFEIMVVRKLLQTLLEAEDRLDVTQLFQEILLAMTHAVCKEHVRDSCLKMFPMSLVEPQTEQIEQGPRHKIRLSYVSDRHSATMLLSPSQRLRPVIADTWINLWNILKLKQYCSVKRFSSNTFQDRFMLALDYSYQVENSGLSPSTPMHSRDLSTLIQATCSDFIVKNIKEHTVDSNLTEINPFKDATLPFPEKDEPDCNQLEHVLSLNLQEMTVHILKYHADEDPVIIHKTASEFISAQLYSCRLLCHLLLKDFNLNRKHMEADSVSWYSKISRLPRETCKRLFSLMEKFQISCTGIAYPIPQGFLPFISVLGYHILSFPLYIQYVDRGALQLRPEVLDYIILELKDDPVSVEKKLEILLRLPRKKAWKHFELWDHPMSLAIQSKARTRLLQTLPNNFNKKDIEETNRGVKGFRLSSLSDKDPNQPSSSLSSTPQLPCNIVTSHTCINGSSESTTL